ncbi:protein kinase domain-containing protein [Allorhizobium taibaishanense]|uniref:Type VI secretion system protein ImpN n=1 Tax=Allorhizobium taibaishanense TaxID=887144 RepID=A0A1Q9A9W1_9HYPH|nr:protein kinase [Allorhizobium taibaishanense]MBB4010032.1 type VI secretion system protein ImpN [Allorhizobium taibaishanense]OLP51642.1 hypothetical protein BJF91_16560 [Allorhizobium taibaishanense]
MLAAEEFAEIAARFTTLMHAVRGLEGEGRRLAIDQLRNALDRQAEALFPSEPGFIAGTFSVEDLMHQGQHSRILKLRHRDIGTLHVLKTLATSAAMAGPSEVERLIGEAKIGLSLNHPTLTACTMLLRLPDGSPGLLQPWGGHSLLHHLEVRRRNALGLAQSRQQTGSATGTTEQSRLDKADGPPDPRQILTALLCSVDALHNKGLVHGDISPANILINETVDSASPAITLADFGLTIEIGRRWRDLGLASIGTPDYSAPEQSADTPATPAMDLFSAGRVLQRILDALGDQFSPSSDRDRLVAISAELTAADPAARPKSAREALALLQERSTI